MKDQGKAKQQLIAENEELRRRVATQEAAESEHKQAEEELRRSEAKWRSVAENAPLFVAVVDQSGKMQFLNRCQPGLDLENVLGRPIYDFLEPQYHAVARKCLEHVFQTGERASYECIGAGPEGSVSEYVTDVGPVIVDGEIIASTLISRDITDPKRAEAALRQSETRFRSLFQDASVGTAVASLSGEFIQVNRAFCRFIGYAEHELVGKTVLSVTHPEDREASSRAIYQAAHSGPRIQRLEKRYLHKSGGVVWGEVSSNLICHADGKPDYFVTQVLDITERKRAEEALKKAHYELEERVKERTAELSTANEQLRIFRMFAEASGQGFGMADMDGLITYLNPALCRMAGVERSEDAIGKRLTTYYPEGYSLRRETEIVPALLQNGHWEGEVVGSLGGKTIFALQNSFLIRDENGNPSRLASVITDITERKQAEEALRASEERLHLTLDAMSDGFWERDMETDTLYFAPRYRALLGYEPEEMPKTHKEWEQYVHPDDLDPALQTVREYIDGRISVFEVEFRAKAKSGEWRWMLGRGKAIRWGSDGQPTRMVGVNIDITDRKRAEEALRASEERFRSYFVQGLIGMAVTGLDKQWRDVNDRLCEILGYPREELVKMKWTEATHPDDLESGLLQFKRIVAGGIDHYTQEKRFVRKDGGIIYANVFVRCFRCRDGTVDHFLTLIEDVTERRQAEEALRQSEERYRTVVEDQTEVIARIRADGTLLFVNEVFCRFFGKTSQELLGSKWQPVAVPEDVPMVEDQLRTLSPSSPIVVIENRVSSGLGQARWMQFVNRGFFDQAGRLTEIQAVGRDITERKQAQEALEGERQTLWHMLQASDHERQIISYEIHDGLAQYLAAAGMQFQAYDSLKEESPDEAKKAYETAVELIRQGHFEARRLISEVRPPVIDENGIEMAISHLVHEQRRRGGPKINFDSDVQFARLPSILENSLYRIAQEALTNACKHSKSKKVKVTLAHEGQEVRLEVRDWGIGFDPESVERGHFGLEGIRQRVRLLDGLLTIESKPGTGTLVQVVVPILEKQNEG